MWLVLLFLGVAAAAPPGADRIIGGYECRPHSQPWLASINLGYHSCGGALIADQWVVSAAHCAYYAQAMLVILGEHNLQVFEHTEHLMHVETVVTHPNYNEETLDYDIMLVKLAQPVQRDANVQPVALPTACAMAGTSCVMSGWGNTLSNGILSCFPFANLCLQLGVSLGPCLCLAASL
ncbi:hypothetical protein Y1Q_0017163 [Alligator mississippiensis]|uniref:Peptidase S1 domain-containing protein n=1 Tax=Alligator mississippiensis TaxID=8496 RepID=A0A151LZN3_ALLMI|nr:hypothetical protein Y1Q_0017163 [Alligator mississippiensis]